MVSVRSSQLSPKSPKFRQSDRIMIMYEVHNDFLPSQVDFKTLFGICTALDVRTRTSHFNMYMYDEKLIVFFKPGFPCYNTVSH